MAGWEGEALGECLGDADEPYERPPLLPPPPPPPPPRPPPLGAKWWMSCASVIALESSPSASRWKTASKASRVPSSCRITFGSPSSARMSSLARHALITSMRESTPSRLTSMRANASAMASSLRPAAAEEKNSPPPPDSPIRSFELRRSRSAESREARPVEEDGGAKPPPPPKPPPRDAPPRDAASRFDDVAPPPPPPSVLRPEAAGTAAE